MHHHQHGSQRQVSGSRGDQRHSVFPGLGRGFQDDDPFVGEQKTG